ncbi:class I SAM-dependent methyltransferase [uncultured Methylibium sp.]|uniref:class I SAM-dependent methyltransferase n=1 Tax=uncultured Methylibium sp. TaxID=381093 RepID=UPI0025E81961|nr:class I SAM-dependent methyltransferase [uncultured Methylibium sp.]
MRDPDAAIEFAPAHVLRHTREPLPADHFLRSALAARWVGDGRLVPFELRDDRTVVAERLPFVTHPYEWSDAQLFEAARLTLQLQQEAVAGGYDLKDASAWNIVFAGTRPVFCDLMSFEPLADRRWWAAGQFARHFLLPLVLAHRRGLPSGATFKAWRDGVPPEVARDLLGPTRFLTRYWPLMAEGRSEPAVALDAVARDGQRPAERIAAFRNRLHATLEWMLQGARPRPPAGAGWQNYEADRTHYGDASLDAKRQLVAQWLRQTAPSWVADLGCNTGEFSRLALAAGAQVVAIDADHDSIQRLFLATPDDARLHPLVAPLDDLTGGRGWAGEEHPGLAQRAEGRFDVVLMLALIHHLAIAAAVPLPQVAALAARWSRRWLIVEFIGEEDPQLRLLCGQRRREPADFGIEAQRQAFVQAGFVVEHEQALPACERTLVLLSLA